MSFAGYGAPGVAVVEVVPASTPASEVLARHDETYMPPEVMDALKRSGHWNPEQGAAPPAREWNTMEPVAAPAAAARNGG